MVKDLNELKYEIYLINIVNEIPILFDYECDSTYVKKLFLCIKEPFTQVFLKNFDELNLLLKYL